MLKMLRFCKVCILCDSEKPFKLLFIDYLPTQAFTHNIEKTQWTQDKRYLTLVYYERLHILNVVQYQVSVSAMYLSII